MARTRSQTKATDSEKHANEKLELPPERAISSSRESSVNRLPPEVFFLIINRLSLKNKFVFKAVCKKWHTLLISDILPKQHKLSIENGSVSDCRCIHPDHQFKWRGNNSITLLPVSGKRNLQIFFEKEVTGLKVLKFCEEQDAIQAMKYYLSEGSCSSLQCLDVECFKEPLVKVLPNLQHFFCKSIRIVPFISILQYCPVLTHLEINTRHSEDDFVDALMDLPKGLQYLKLEGKSCDFLAVLCSPAMETLESVLLRSANFAAPVPFNKPDARVKPAPRLQRFSMGTYMRREEDRRMIVDFTKECPVLKKIDLQVIGLTVADYVNIYSQLFDLEMMTVGLDLHYDDVIHMIVLRNRESLKHLEIGYPFFNLESTKKVAEFKNLQTLSFCSVLPSDEQLIAFAQRRLDVSVSRLQLKFYRWKENLRSNPLGPALEAANIEVVPYGKYRSVMD